MRKELIAGLMLALISMAAPARAAEHLKVVLDWFVNPDHGPLVVALERGYFAQAGLEVELVAPADPNDPPKLVAAGEADIAVSYQPQLPLQVAAGLPLVRIGTLIASPLNCVLVLADGPVKTLTDLKGRKVGFSVGGFEDAVLRRMLESVGLTLDQVQLVNVNFALTAALLSGQVDAVIGAYRNFELNQLAIEGHPGRAFLPEEHGVPAYDELILLAHRDHLADPRLPRFLAALERAVQFIQSNPEAAWDDFARYRPELDDALNRRAWTDTVPRFAPHPALLDRNRYRRFAEFLKDQGLIPEALPVDRYAVELP